MNIPIYQDQILVDNVIGNNFVVLNKKLVRELGDREAMLVAFLVDKRRYWASISELQPDGSFFWTGEDLEQELGWGEDIRRRVQARLVNAGVITVTKKGLPAKNFYKINDKRLIEILSSSPTSCGHENRTSSRHENGTTRGHENGTVLKNSYNKNSGRENSCSAEQQEQDEGIENLQKDLSSPSASKKEEDRRDESNSRQDTPFIYWCGGGFPTETTADSVPALVSDPVCPKETKAPKRPSLDAILASWRNTLPDKPKWDIRRESLETLFATVLKYGYTAEDIDRTFERKAKEPWTGGPKTKLKEGIAEMIEKDYQAAKTILEPIELTEFVPTRQKTSSRLNPRTPAERAQILEDMMDLITDDDIVQQIIEENRMLEEMSDEQMALLQEIIDGK